MDHDTDTPEFEGQIIFKGDYGHHSHKETVNAFKERLSQVPTGLGRLLQIS